MMADFQNGFILLNISLFLELFSAKINCNVFVESLLASFFEF